MPPPGDTSLGEFELSRVLGEGGSGTVYDARHGSRRVALKVLRQDLALSARDARRFVEEAQRMGQVDHPGLVKLESAGVLPDGRPYIAMQLLDGETLAGRLSRGPLPPDEAIRVFAELARAVAALHEAGFIHRDIKPENIVMVGELEALSPVLLDFGIAREISSSPSTTTASGAVRGTPAYMAPERLFGGPATVRSDVYELALTLHMMLVGKLPWPVVDGVAQRLAPPAELGAAVPADIARAVRRALSTRPEVRPESAEALAREVERAWQARDTPAPPGAVTEDLVRTLSVRPTAVAAQEGNRTLGRFATVAGVAMVAGAVLVGVQLFGAAAPDRSERLVLAGWGDRALGPVAAPIELPEPSTPPSPPSPPSRLPPPTVRASGVSRMAPPATARARTQAKAPADEPFDPPAAAAPQVEPMAASNPAKGSTSDPFLEDRR